MTKFDWFVLGIVVGVIGRMIYVVFAKIWNNAKKRS